MPSASGERAVLTRWMNEVEWHAHVPKSMFAADGGSHVEACLGCGQTVLACNASPRWAQSPGLQQMCQNYCEKCNASSALGSMPCSGARGHGPNVFRHACIEMRQFAWKAPSCFIDTHAKDLEPRLRFQPFNSPCLNVQAAAYKRICLLQAWPPCLQRHMQ